MSDALANVCFWQISLKNSAMANLLSQQMLSAAEFLRSGEALGHCRDDQLCELSKVLSGGSQEEFVFCSGWTAQPQTSQADDAFEVREQHFDLFAFTSGPLIEFCAD